MRHRLAPPAFLALILLLSGCVSERHFVRDSWPFGNPNAPPVTSETAQRAVGQVAVITPIVPQAGNVWPGPVQPVPTLSDMSQNATAPLGTGYTPSLPSPYPPGVTPPPDDVVPYAPPISNGSGYSVEPGGGAVAVPAVPGDAR